MTLQMYKVMSPEELKENLTAISRGGHKASKIIDALLLLAQIRNIDTPLEIVDMMNIQFEMKFRLEPMIEEYEATVIWASDMPKVVAHPLWIEEILINYLSNALKYGGRPPVVELGWEQNEKEIKLWVVDNGRGLTPDEQALMFVPFTQLKQAEVEGHGLGLSIVQRIAEKLGGRVGVESEAGQGSKFWFTLPNREEKLLSQQF